MAALFDSTQYALTVLAKNSESQYLVGAFMGCKKLNMSK